MLFKVWYAKTPMYDFYRHKGSWSRLSVANLEDTHRLVKVIEAEDRDAAWVAMQGENWSPRGEARPLIEKLGLTHTSMSIGDVLQSEHGEYWIVNDFGWVDLRPTCLSGETFHGTVKRDLGISGLKRIGATIKAGEQIKVKKFRASPSYPPSEKYLMVLEGKWKGAIVDLDDLTDLQEWSNDNVAKAEV